MSSATKTAWPISPNSYTYPTSSSISAKCCEVSASSVHRRHQIQRQVEMTKKPTVLRFVLQSMGNPMGVMSRFHPQGKTVLNRTEWRGKEPRSCAVTSLRGRPYKAGSKDPQVWDVEVAYRPKGTITFVGNTKYDGWTAMILDRAKDGTLLDGHGKPLPDGQPPVYLPYEMYEDVEFNDIDFGEFVEEVDVGGIKHISFEDMMR